MAIPFALPLQAPITDENKLAASENVPDSLEDIAAAGSGISFSSGETENFTVIGNLNIIDKIASGFSANNYIIIPQSAAQMECTLYFKVRTGNDLSGQPYIYVKDGFDALWADSNGKNNAFWTWSWSQKTGINLKNDVQNNTIYWIKVVLEIGKRTYYFSIDGETYDSGHVVTDTSYTVGSEIFYIGNCQYNTYWKGSIYLNDCHIKSSNENVIWQAYTSTQKIISANVDQVYSGSSTNAQSGAAVKSAIDSALNGYATTTYVDEQLGDIETLLAAL